MPFGVRGLSNLSSSAVSRVMIPLLIWKSRNVCVGAGNEVDHQGPTAFVNGVGAIVRDARRYDALCFFGVALARSLAAIFGISARD
jgi:hypothetical protein